MKRKYRMEQFPETGDSYPVRVFLMKDEVTVALDTTGESLHKRGYRKYKVTAPIAENLAAGLLMLTPWRPGRILVDPFCGSGTFPIEAAMISANIAPGVNRTFTAETWKHLVPASVWKDSRDEALEMETPNIETDLQGYDINPDAIAAARTKFTGLGATTINVVIVVCTIVTGFCAIDDAITAVLIECTGFRATAIDTIGIVHAIIALFRTILNTITAVSSLGAILSTTAIMAIVVVCAIIALFLTIDHAIAAMLIHLAGS